MAYKEGVYGGFISLLIGAFMAWTAFEYLDGSSGLQIIIYTIGGFLVLFGIFAISISLRSPK